MSIRGSFEAIDENVASELKSKLNKSTNNEHLMNFVLWNVDSMNLSAIRKWQIVLIILQLD